ncbi:MAG: hypothetical protein ACHQIO_02960 [Nevskiales bacterium]
MNQSRSRQHGGMLSLLLVLVAIGLLAYFALRPHTARQEATSAGGEQQLVSCTKLTGELIQRTGGLGPDYKTGYEALPPNCRGLLPAPAPAPNVPE